MRNLLKILLQELHESETLIEMHCQASAKGVDSGINEDEKSSDNISLTRQY